MTKDKVLANFVQSRHALLAAVAGLSEEQMAGTQVIGIWTIKDVLGHIATWDQAVLEPLRRFAEGGAFEAEIVRDEDTWNERQADKKRALPLEAIHEQLSVVRRDLLAVAGRLTEAQWNQSVLMPWGAQNTIGDGLNELCGHEWEHLRAIEHWRAASAPARG